jgi:hypothetical protein
MGMRSRFSGISAMNPRTVGLRVSSVVFGLVCLLHIARLFAGTVISVGGYRLGSLSSWVCIIGSGGLSIWLSRLAGPWSNENGEG